jgi:uncharacterized protein YcfJ
MRKPLNVLSNTQVFTQSSVLKKAYMLVPVILAAGFSMSAKATDQYIDTARVLSVTPQTERVNMPRQECRTEYQQQSYREDRSLGGAVIGGIAGGLLGSTVGRGNGRVAAAAVGAGVGAIVGDRVDNNNRVVNTRTVPVEACYTVDSWQTVNTGYLVTYEYNGRTYTTVTNEAPGRYIDVNVAVGPNRYPAQEITYIRSTGYDEPRWNKRDNGKHRGWDKHHKHDRDRRYY